MRTPRVDSEGFSMDVIYTLFACDQWKNGAKVEVLKLPLDISHLCLAGSALGFALCH